MSEYRLRFYQPCPARRKHTKRQRALLERVGESERGVNRDLVSPTPQSRSIDIRLFGAFQLRRKSVPPSLSKCNIDVLHLVTQLGDQQLEVGGHLRTFTQLTDSDSKTLRHTQYTTVGLESPSEQPPSLSHTHPNTPFAARAGHPERFALTPRRQQRADGGFGRTLRHTSAWKQQHPLSQIT